MQTMTANRQQPMLQDLLCVPLHVEMLRPHWQLMMEHTQNRRDES
jgi:hypothetical protein